MGSLTAVGVVLILFGAVWFIVPGPTDAERRGVAVGAALVGVVLLVVSLL